LGDCGGIGYLKEDGFAEGSRPRNCRISGLGIRELGTWEIMIKKPKKKKSTNGATLSFFWETYGVE
jgi:hypothetical protein